eukprot:2589683-Rhodomonas_salina.4
MRFCLPVPERFSLRVTDRMLAAGGGTASVGRQRASERASVVAFAGSLHALVWGTARNAPMVDQVGRRGEEDGKHGEEHPLLQLSAVGGQTGDQRRKAEPSHCTVHAAAHDVGGEVVERHVRDMLVQESQREA